ncbi:unnamed protein product [Ceratitis capitata]|uniref:(Mediterranean fruit fly) hypothetical protein n=1 Tax=Ceratitis capitata TaxID=7213 RepID=A0A811URD3_CERCA|nr:unnamed protein product [Ceratitis capitata]
MSAYGPTAERLVHRHVQREDQRINLELTYDMSTDSWALVIRNFMSRRGLKIRRKSDYGNNFTTGEYKRFPDDFNFCSWVSTALRTRHSANPWYVPMKQLQEGNSVLFFDLKVFIKE